MGFWPPFLLHFSPWALASSNMWFTDVFQLRLRLPLTQTHSSKRHFTSEVPSHLACRTLHHEYTHAFTDLWLTSTKTSLMLNWRRVKISKLVENKTGDWQDDWADKVFALLAWGSEFRSPENTLKKKKTGWEWQSPVIPGLDRQREGTPRWLARLANLCSERPLL